MVRIDEKQGTMVPSLMPQQNLLPQVKFKGVENGFKTWLAKQSLPVEAAVETAAHAACGGAFMGTLVNTTSSFILTHSQASLNPESIACFKHFQAHLAPLVLARDIAIMRGVNAGISCVMKRLTGKEDVQTR